MTLEDLEQLIVQYGNEIYGFCYHLTGCREDADDLYQDTLCKAYEIHKKINHTAGTSGLRQERNYCMGIAVRLYKNMYRKRNRHKMESIDNEDIGLSNKLATDSDMEEIVIQRQIQSFVRKCIFELPLKQRTVIYMFYYAELSQNEISVLLRIPEGTVKSRLSTARSSLKKIFMEKWKENGE